MKFTKSVKKSKAPRKGGISRSPKQNLPMEKSNGGTHEKKPNWEDLR